jgi:hypothetical protein
MTFIYLHGWASGPFSNKARFFSQRFAQQGLTLYTPDLNQDDFFHLTLSRQIQQVTDLLSDQAVTVIGSSFGGLTALWVAEQRPQVERLVLLAPALEFATRCLTLVPEAQQIQWREQGVLNLYHYAQERELPLSYHFIEDLQQYHDSHLQRRVPTLILHGIHDEVVPIQASRNFLKTRPWVKLVELDSDHSLANVQEQLWQALYSFCQLNYTL